MASLSNESKHFTEQTIHLQGFYFPSLLLGQKTFDMTSRYCGVIDLRPNITYLLSYLVSNLFFQLIRFYFTKTLKLPMYGNIALFVQK